MKTTQIEQDDIQITISILQASLKKLKNKVNNLDDDFKKIVEKRISETEKELEYYRRNHSEYFI